MEPVTSGRPYPDAAELAAHVASLYGLRRILDVGGAWTPELSIAYPALRPMAGGRPAAALVTGESRALLATGGALAGLTPLLAGLSLLVVATDDAAPVLEWLAAHGLRPAFSGRTRAHEADTERSGRLVVVDRALDRAVSEAGVPPDDFRVVALMAAYNEEDVIGSAIEKLAGDDVGVYVIDNWSTDRTWEIVESLQGRGVVGLERFPARPGGSFVLRALLRRTTELAASLDATWFIHHDADERRVGPWPDFGLRESLWRVDRAGFNAVDFTVANYRPIDDGFEPGDDFERYFRHFEFGATSDLLLQIKAWKNVGRVDLAGAAGHQARFRGRRVFPYKFLLKHYPIRSQAHGERKIFHERIPRWDRHERVRGWHVHYNEFSPGQSFLRDPAELIQDRGEETRTAYLPELLAGAGLIRRDYPAWALESPTGRAAFLARQSVDRSRPVGLWRNVVGKGRGAFRRLRSTVGRGR
jgi:glycosyltransferase involved in cell wall biosynthesis